MRNNESRLSNLHVTYLVGACCAVIALVAFVLLLVIPAVSSYRRGYEKAIALVLTGYVFAALCGIGVVIGYVIITEWPNIVS